MKIFTNEMPYEEDIDVDVVIDDSPVDIYDPYVDVCY